jgi:hypothetical protein
MPLPAASIDGTLRHPKILIHDRPPEGASMRAELETVVAEIQQSLGLLRRHL